MQHAPATDFFIALLIRLLSKQSFFVTLKFIGDVSFSVWFVLMAVEVAAKAIFLAFMCMSHTREAACELVQRQGKELCRYNTRADCIAESGDICEWCDLSQLCSPVAYMQEDSKHTCLDTTERQRRRLLEDDECSSIAKKGLCTSVDYCRWCRSKVLDDYCFGAAEAARLPRAVFDCSLET